MKEKENALNLGCVIGLIGLAGVFIYMIYFFLFDRSAPFWPLIIMFIFLLIGGISSQIMTNDEEKKEFKQKGIDKKYFIYSGKYLHGLIDIVNSKENTFIYLLSAKFYIYYQNLNNTKKEYLSELSYSDIINVYIEDKSSIQSRVGLKRLIVTGVFAFALKKKEKIELKYIVIEWTNNGFKNDLIFEFEGSSVENVNKVFNDLQEKIIEFRKSAKLYF